MNNKLVKTMIDLNGHFNKLRLGYVNDEATYFTFDKHYKNTLYTLTVTQHPDDSIETKFTKTTFVPENLSSVVTIKSSTELLTEEITTSLDTIDFAYRLESLIK